MHFEDQCVRRTSVNLPIVERYKTSLKWLTPEISVQGKKYKAFERKMDIFSGKERKNRQSLQWNEVLQVYKIFQSDNKTYSLVKFISSSLWPPRRHSSKCLCHPFSQEPLRSPTLLPEILPKWDPWGKTGDTKTILTLFGRSVSHSCSQYLINRRGRSSV